MRKFRRGQFVVYDEPIPRTGMPAQDFESDSVIRHYMIVSESSKKGTLVLQATSGQLIVTHRDNPNVRRARFWERIFKFDRFPSRNGAKRQRLSNRAT